MIDDSVKKSGQAANGIQYLPESIDQGQKNKQGHDDNKKIFLVEKSGSDDDFTAMLADGHLCVDRLVAVGTADNVLCCVVSFGNVLFQFPVNVIGPFTVDGGAFPLQGHAVCPDECLQAIGAGNFLHRWSPSALLAKGSFSYQTGPDHNMFAGATGLLQVTADFKV
jgi:hypothetical protein